MMTPFLIKSIPTCSCSRDGSTIRHALGRRWCEEYWSIFRCCIIAPTQRRYQGNGSKSFPPMLCLGLSGLNYKTGTYMHMHMHALHVHLHASNPYTKYLNNKIIKCKIPYLPTHHFCGHVSGNTTFILFDLKSWNLDRLIDGCLSWFKDYKL